jgi:hypothetical protein
MRPVGHHDGSHGIVPAADRATAARRLGLGAVLAGIVLAGWAQFASPIAGPPLYDGVVVADPYRFLQPAAGQRGGPQPASGTVQVRGGAYPLLAVATPEYPPQAQLLATGGAFDPLPAGTTSITVDIRPVPPPPIAPAGQIAGNVYSITVKNQAGAELTATPGSRASIVMRAPQGIAVATIERFADGAWQPIDTAPETSGMFLAIVTDFGDFALVAPASPPSPGTSVALLPGPPGTGPATSGPAPPGPGAVPSGEGAPGGGDIGGISPLLLVALVAVLVVGLVLFGLSER